MAWATVAEKAIDFLASKGNLGVVIVLLAFVLVGWLTPMGMVAWMSWDNTNRVVSAIQDLGTRMDNKLTQR